MTCWLFNILMRWFYYFHYLLYCDRPTILYQLGVLCTTNILSFRWYCFPPPLLYLPESRVGYPWCSMVLHFLDSCWVSMMYSFSHSWTSGPLKIEIGYVNTWGLWWTTSRKSGGCCISLGPCTLPYMLKIICLPTTHSYWYPCSTWIVGMMRCSRGLIIAPKFMSWFYLKYRPHFPLYNLYIFPRYFMLEVRYFHCFRLSLDVWSVCAYVRAHIFTMTKNISVPSS